MFIGLLPSFKAVFTLTSALLVKIRMTDRQNRLVAVSVGVNASNSPKP
jgi:hypothetical protein